MRRRSASGLARKILLVAALLVVAGALGAAPSFAGHEHSNAPCWSNGYGDGADNDGYAHPYIHYAGDASCGYNALAPNMSISFWFDYDAGSGVNWGRVYLRQCGYVYNCDRDLYPSYNECRYRAGLEAISPIPHHWHYHHYQCTSV